MLLTGGKSPFSNAIQGCQIYLDTTNPNGQNMSNYQKIPKWP
jgi:hypothetical protein